MPIFRKSSELNKTINEVYLVYNVQMVLIAFES